MPELPAMPKRRSLLPITIAAAVPIGAATILSFPAGLGLMGAYLGGTILVSNVKLKGFRVEGQAAIDGLAEGKFGDAVGTFQKWASSRIPIIAASARHNLAWALARRGELRRAIEIAEDNEQKSGSTLVRLAIRGLAAANLALYRALVGDLDAARAALTGTHGTPGPTDATMITLAKAVIAARAGTPADATRLDASQDDRVAETTIRLLQQVRAFIRKDPPLAPEFEDEFTFLGVSWPEMAAFLA